MKRKILMGIITAIAVLSPFACDKLLNVDFTYEMPFTFSINPVEPGYYQYAEVLIISTLESKLNEYNASLDKLESMKLKSFEVGITNPSGFTFDPFDYLEVYISADALNAKLIAQINPVPQGGNTYLSFDAEDVELADYFKKEEIHFIVKGKNSIKTTQVSSFATTVQYTVNAQAL